jgi:hypothetical protein
VARAERVADGFPETFGATSHDAGFAAQTEGGVQRNDVFLVVVHVLR